MIGWIFKIKTTDGNDISVEEPLIFQNKGLEMWRELMVGCFKIFSFCFSFFLWLLCFFLSCFSLVYSFSHLWPSHISPALNQNTCVFKNEYFAEEPHFTPACLMIMWSRGSWIWCQHSLDLVRVVAHLMYPPLQRLTGASGRFPGPCLTLWDEVRSASLKPWHFLPCFLVLKWSESILSLVWSPKDYRVPQTMLV